MATSARGEAAIALARFDDREELCRTLGLDAQCRDSELVLRSYQRWGPAFVARLSGEFAAVVWDPAVDQLLCAVDSFGIGSLFVVQGRGGLRGFTSQMSLARQIPGTERTLDLEVVGRYVGQLPVPAERTSFREISRVGPGCWVGIGPSGNLRRVQYWSLHDIHPTRLARDEDYVSAFRAALARSLARRLAGVRSALSLSGGLDSGSLLGLAVSHGIARELVPLTAVPERRECNEESRVSELCSVLGVQPRWLRPDVDLQGFREACRVSGEPRFLAHFPIVLAVARAASESGAQRVLTGAYGDLVGGAVLRTALLSHLLRSGHWLEWWSELGARRSGRTVRATLSSVARALPGFDRLRRDHRARAIAPTWWPLTALQPGALRDLGLEEARQDVARDVDASLRCLNYGRIRWLERTILFETEFTGRAAAYRALESAHPFADREVVGLTLSMPATLLAGRGLSRIPLRRAMTGILPEAIRAEPRKVIFNSMYQEMFRGVGDQLLDRGVASSLEPLIDWDRLRRGTSVASSYSEHLHLWRCLAVNAWMLDHGSDSSGTDAYAG